MTRKDDQSFKELEQKKIQEEQERVRKIEERRAAHKRKVEERVGGFFVCALMTLDALRTTYAAQARGPAGGGSYENGGRAPYLASCPVSYGTSS